MEAYEIIYRRMSRQEADKSNAQGGKLTNGKEKLTKGSSSDPGQVDHSERAVRSNIRA